MIGATIPGVRAVMLARDPEAMAAGLKAMRRRYFALDT
jgi:hypothetical protein